MDDELDKALAKLRGQQSAPSPDPMDAALAKIRAASPQAAPAVDATKGTAWEGKEYGHANEALRGASLHFYDKLSPAVHAVGDMITHGDSFGAAYDKEKAGQDAARATYQNAHPVASKVSEFGGGIATAIATDGGSLIGPAAKLLPRIVAGAKAGAKFGAITGAADASGDVSDYAAQIAEESALGGLAGGALAPAFSLVGAGARAVGLPQGASYVAGKASSLLPQGSRAAQFLESVAGSLGRRGKAATEIGSRLEQDAAAGHTPTPQPASFPSMAIDQSGANVRGLAQNIAHRPGPGSSVMRSSLQERAGEMRPNVTQALEQGTGLSADAAESVLPDAIAKQKAVADQAFSAARAATQGQAIDSPTFQEVMKTPAGRSAFAWARVQKANRGSAMPTVTTDPPAPSGFTDDQWSSLLQRMRARGVEVPAGDTKELPDPETLHYMKQALSKMARLGFHDGAQGTVATQAQGALGVWGNIRNELPAIWQQADDATAEQFRLIDAANRGRNIFRSSTNPGTPNPRKAAQQALGAVEQRIAGSTPEEQTMTQQGAASAAHTLMQRAPQSMQSPGRVFSQSPERVRQLQQAFPNADASQGFQGTVKAWDDAAKLVQQVLGGSQTAARLGEEAMRDNTTPGVVGHLVAGNIGNAAGALKTGLLKEAQQRARQKLDEDIARALTQRGGSLQSFQKSYDAQRWLSNLYRLSQGVGGSELSSRALTP